MSSATWFLLTWMRAAAIYFMRLEICSVGDLIRFMKSIQLHFWDGTAYVCMSYFVVDTKSRTEGFTWELI